jgi:hypothetical protein
MRFTLATIAMSRLVFSAWTGARQQIAILRPGVAAKGVLQIVIGFDLADDGLGVAAAGERLAHQAEPETGGGQALGHVEAAAALVAHDNTHAMTASQMRPPSTPPTIVHLALGHSGAGDLGPPAWPRRSTNLGASIVAACCACWGYALMTRYLVDLAVHGCSSGRRRSQRPYARVLSQPL